MSMTDDKNPPTPLVNGPEQFSGSGEIGLGEAPDGLINKARKRKQRKAFMFMGLLAIAALIILTLIFLALFGRSPIPGMNKAQPAGYSTSIYGSSKPLGVAISNSRERIYVTESDGNRVVNVYDPSGDKVGTLSPPMKTESQRLPVYVAVDPLTDDVYVSDRLRRAVDIYSPKGSYRGKFKPSGFSMKGSAPLGLTFDKRGNLYITDVSGPTQKILVFGTDRKLLRKIGSKRQLLFPNGIAVDKKGRIYVSDSNHGRLAIFNSTGKLVASIGRGVGPGDLGLPRGVAIDTNDRMYVVDTTNQNVKVYRLGKRNTPSYIGSFGEEGAADGEFEYPNGIDVDGKGKVYVTDRENSRVQVWNQ